jgi:hypothetical protein
MQNRINQMWRAVGNGSFLAERKIRRRKLHTNDKLFFLLPVLSLVVFLSSQTAHTRLMRATGPIPVSFQIDLILPARLSTAYDQHTAQVKLPDNLAPRGNPRYNGITYVPAENFRRSIPDNDAQLFHQQRNETLSWLDALTDEKDISYNEPERFYHYEERTYTQTGCYRPRWSFEAAAACNQCHESWGRLEREPSRLQPFDINYLDEGHFRTTYRFNATNLSGDIFVLKQIKLHERRNWNAFTFDQIQLEELTFLQTQGSPNTNNLYGRCGTSVAVEAGLMITDSIYYEENLLSNSKVILEKHRRGESANQLTDEQRLHIAMAMAESLADLHGK